MKYIKAIIGANFGDEGKGMVTHYFASRAENPVLNVLYNGGMQRGHTVGDHIYHCFGSGNGAGADTYYGEHFIINPIAWNIEYSTLNEVRPCYLNEKCRLTIPFDEAINQAIEDRRGIWRHGSCGMGVFETRIRNEQYPFTMREAQDPYLLYNYLKKIQTEYVPARCKELGINIDMNINIDLYLAAVNALLNMCNVISNEAALFNKYQTIIFEAGQGLLLSEDNVSYMPHLTPSYTGSYYIADIINSQPSNVDVEICYVTRSYMTRHGAGRFDTECHKEDINKDIEDKTNQPNKYQQSLRFGWIDINDFILRIENDLRYYKRPYKSSVAITQLNYTEDKIPAGKIYISIDTMARYFDKCYISRNKDIVQPYVLIS